MITPTGKQDEKRISEPITNDETKALASEIEQVLVQDQTMSFLSAVKLYPKAVAWSLVLSTALVMEGYDTALLKSLFALPTFQETYTRSSGDGAGQISAPWQAGLTNGSSIGQLLGLVLSGYLSERIGFRWSLILGLSTAIATIFIQFFSTSLAVLQVGQVFLGIPLGLMQVIPVVYAYEISPLCLRPYLTTYANLSWILGHLIELGVLRGVLGIDSNWAYRIPFAIQWFWPVLLIPLIFLAPENPWWLARKGRLEDAKQTLLRLTKSEDVHRNIDQHLALMIGTIEHEREISEGTSYRACFQASDLRRTMIVTACYSIQLLSGNSLRGYSTYYFQQAGLATTQSFNMSIVGVALSLIGMIMAWFLLPHFGRRTIFLWGLTGLLLIWAVTGGVGVAQKRDPSPALAWAIGGLMLASSFVYDFTIGPVVYAFITEIPSSLLRSKSAAISRWVYAVVSIICNVITPYQLNKTAWNWGAEAGFFWGGTTLLSLAFAFFCIPETKGRTTLEMDILFERKVPARHFKTTDIDSVEEVVKHHVV